MGGKAGTSLHPEIRATDLQTEELTAEDVGVRFVVLGSRQLALLQSGITTLLRRHLMATLSSP
jgi:hypothetical protein